MSVTLDYICSDCGLTVVCAAGDEPDALYRWKDLGDDGGQCFGCWRKEGGVEMLKEDLLRCVREGKPLPCAFCNDGRKADAFAPRAEEPDDKVEWLPVCALHLHGWNDCIPKEDPLPAYLLGPPADPAWLAGTVPMVAVSEPHVNGVNTVETAKA